MLNKDKILLESLVEKYGAKEVESAINRLNEDNSSEIMSIDDAFNYCKEKLGARMRWEKYGNSYEISPGFGTFAKYTFVLYNAYKEGYGPVIMFTRYNPGPNSFTMDKSIQRDDIYFVKYFFGEEKQYWRPTKEVLDKLIDACLERFHEKK